MKHFAAFMLAAGTVVGATEILDAIVPETTATVAEASINGVAEQAYMLNLLGMSWPEALAQSITDLRRGEDALTLTGTTLTWAAGEYCYTADLPTPQTPVTVTGC